MTPPIPVIDIFAGPGGLGEGFTAFRSSSNEQKFRIGLSIEKEERAHETLELRSFFRQFQDGDAPAEYYEHIRDPKQFSREELFNCYEDQADAARAEAWHATLGETPQEEVDRRIKKALIGRTPWILIGGPPCQAYSIVGRSRTGGIDPKDHRVYLYREYLRILARHSPSVFVMENVKGILSSKVNGNPIFEQILLDLEYPARAVRESDGKKTRGLNNHKYQVYSLVVKSRDNNLFDHPCFKPKDFLIFSERYGIPQARHRVILLGIRTDLECTNPPILSEQKPVTFSDVLNGLPRLRSGLSRQKDSPENWRNIIKDAVNQPWFRQLQKKNGSTVEKRVRSATKQIRVPRFGRGGEYIPAEVDCDYSPDWFLDSKLNGVCNHTTRSHIVYDLYRYLFAACFAKCEGRSPHLKDFPEELLPKHENVSQAVEGGHFGDRFRVQVSNKPSTTITSHLSKDGHYFIYPDPCQCRSLTVRESARLQTFPDNYFFCGQFVAI